MSNNQLPAEAQERIKADADKYFSGIYNCIRADIQPFHITNGYIAGATAETERTQEVINAAEKVAKIFAHDDGNCAICELAKALQQWKEGKEVGR